MKNTWLHTIYAYFAACCILFSACTDEEIVEGVDGKTVSLLLNISLPGSDAGGLSRNTYEDGGLDYDTELQRYIADGDVYVLVFDEEGKLKEVPEMTISPNQGETYRVLNGKISYSEEPVTLAVLTNLGQQSILGTQPGTVRTALLAFEGQTAENIYKELVYYYPQRNPWNIENRYLPMWGKPDGTFIPNQNVEASCDLYRALAKMGVTVDDACTNFTLKTVEVYHVNAQGHCASLKTPDADEAIQYSEPSIPEGCTQLANPLKYTLTDDEVTVNGITNRIYVPEADNPDALVDEADLLESNAFYLVVGGIYTDDDQYKDNTDISYYHIFMKDDKDEEGVDRPFDIIRNHSYIFNIQEVRSPGTPGPEILEGEEALTVEVLDYTEEPMRGIDSQYTLTVDKSSFNFNGLVVDGKELNIWTDGTKWKLATDATGADAELKEGEDGKKYYEAEWFTVTEMTHSDNKGQLVVLPKVNIDGEIRTATFYIKAGKILKQITISQNSTETANSYIASTDQQYILYTGVPGNRNKWSSDHPDFNPPAWNAENDPNDGYDDVSFGQSLTLDVTHIGIIWETVQGLIMVEDPDNPGTYKPLHSFTSGAPVHDYTGCIPYKVDASKKDQWGGGVLTPGHGGNALIGGFNKDNDLVWSWHIWVVGDYANGVKEEEWVTGVMFIDRYLGAYSNEPGSRSYGLLYQWGRKDPFIGPARDNLERNYKQVPKAKTQNYEQHGVQYVWKDWSVADGEEQVMNTISRPTTLLTTGILNDHATLDGAPDNLKGIWGTKSLDPEIKDNGAKTMWDPSPPGYRIPSLHSWIFEDKFPSKFIEVNTANFSWNDDYRNEARNHVNTEYTSYEQNYDSNVWFVPYKTTSHWPINDYGWWGYDAPGTTKFDSDEPYYGFWLYYGAYAIPDRTKVRVDENGQLDSSLDSEKYTWFPIAGCYDGTMFPNGGQHTLNGEIPAGFGACGTIHGGESAKYAASSIHVNSGIWLNSPILIKGGSQRPAGVFLHGTEGRYDSSSDTDGRPSYVNEQQGRHIHALNANTTKYTAHPNYALNVRCVRDKDELVIDESNVSSDKITLTVQNDYKMEVTLHAVQAWYVASPGAPWVTVSPDKSYTAGDVTLKISCETPGVGEKDLEAVILIRAGQDAIGNDVILEIEVTRQ